MVENHRHTGTDSPQLDGSSFIGAPLPAITPDSGGTLSSGGANNLKTTDSDIIQNMRIRITALEDALQALLLLR